jgi:hypothetical protein
MESQLTTHHKRVETDVLARQGLRLPAITLKRLRTAGIYCQPSASIEHQHLAKKYVLRGVESGGAVAEVGAYASFVDEQGNALPWLQRVDSIGVNGVRRSWSGCKCFGSSGPTICSLPVTVWQNRGIARGHAWKARSSFMVAGAVWRWSCGDRTPRTAAPSVRFSTLGRGNVWCCQTTSKMLPPESHLPCAASAAVIVICSDLSRFPLTGWSIAAPLM